MECDKPITTTYIGQVPIDTLDAVPDYVLTERDVIDPNTGKTIRSLVRTPGPKLFAGGNFDNVITLEANNAIEVPENQVLAGRIVNNGSYNTVELTTTSTQPDFIILGKLGGQVLIQSTGFVYMPNGHQYVVGAQYYSGENGMPTTDSASGYKLFKPISSTKLVLTLGQ